MSGFNWIMFIVVMAVVVLKLLLGCANCFLSEVESEKGERLTPHSCSARTALARFAM